MSGWKLDATAWDWITAGIILGSGLLAALLVGLLWRSLFRPLAIRFGADPNNSILSPLRGFVLGGLILTALYYAVSSLAWVESNPKFEARTDKFFAVLWAMLIVRTLFRIFNLSVDWYTHRATQRPEGPQDVSNQAMLLRKVGNVILLTIGLLSVLHVAGTNLSPLLASGAIGGLAIALAAQDTFSNLFAGFFLAIDRPIRSGDFIKLETGQEGYVQEIGWRNTRVRMLQNSTVIIPNSKLSQSVVTNYNLPEAEVSLIVPVSVAYKSDLQRVEQIALEVAREIQQRVEGAVPEWEPTLYWREFTDFGVRFHTTLRLRNYPSHPRVQSEFLETLYTRLRAEEIEVHG